MYKEDKCIFNILKNCFSLNFVMQLVLDIILIAKHDLKLGKIYQDHYNWGWLLGRAFMSLGGVFPSKTLNS